MAAVGYDIYGVLRGPRVKRVTVPLARLPRSARGLWNAVVSDVHLSRSFTGRVVATVNAPRPGLIAVVGDLVDGLGPAVEPLSGLRARHGAYYVTGNHDYICGAEQGTTHVREPGLRLLAGERVEPPAFDMAGGNEVTGEDPRRRPRPRGGAGGPRPGPHAGTAGPPAGLRGRGRTARRGPAPAGPPPRRPAPADEPRRRAGREVVGPCRAAEPRVSSLSPLPDRRRTTSPPRGREG
ncbi:metallophosphoesterase [Streptomyces sp. NPDC000348]|uniref:metallophosphoesterase n=1 Tax=Streptomyces sp. NPDC000348 TaxID=3364538 RepID=UPI00367531F0